MSVSPCAIAGVCGGCPWIARPYSSQLEEKRRSIREGLAGLGLPWSGPLEIHSVGEFRTRDRVDLNLKTGRLGLYDTAKTQLLDLTACPQMTEPLERWLVEFREDLPPVEKGTVRLRVAPGGERGVWLDFANEDTKRLLDERAWLERLATRAIVEIGQRKKRLVQKEGRLGLGDPVLAVWMESFGLGPIPLFTAIGSFTQPGHVANRRLVEVVMGQILASGERGWLELGSGCGNFTLPMLQNGLDVLAVESDPIATAGLTLGVEQLGELASGGRFECRETNFDRFNDYGPERALLVDPPRSGMGRFLDRVEREPSRLASTWIYVSCSQESFLKDAGRLLALGYRIVQLEGVDQFPQTSATEWVATFKR